MCGDRVLEKGTGAGEIFLAYIGGHYADIKIKMSLDVVLYHACPEKKVIRFLIILASIILILIRVLEFEIKTRGNFGVGVDNHCPARENF